MRPEEFLKRVHPEFEKFRYGAKCHMLEEKARMGYEGLLWEAFLAGWFAAGGEKPWDEPQKPAEEPN